MIAEPQNDAPEGPFAYDPEHTRFGSPTRVVTWPLAATVWLLVLFLLVILVYGALGSYTRKAALPGQVVPEGGITLIHSAQSGVVSARLASDGQVVAAGQPLIRISSERQLRNGSFDATMSRLSEGRRKLLVAERTGLDTIQRRDRAEAEQAHDALAIQVQESRKQAALQARRLKSAEERLEKLQDMARSGFLSQSGLEDQRIAVGTEAIHQSQLSAQITRQNHELVAASEQLKSLPFKQSNERARVEREIASIQEGQLQTEASREIQINAPFTGVVTTSLAQVGQSVGPAQVLMGLVPETANLKVEAFASSRDIGFIRPGNRVRVSYEAFPYQKFGLYDGEVESVSRLPVGADQLTLPLPNDHLYYRVLVKLQMPHVMAYNRKQALQPGMRLTANVHVEQRSLLEWFIEPVLSLRGFVS